MLDHSSLQPILETRTILAEIIGGNISICQKGYGNSFTNFESSELETRRSVLSNPRGFSIRI
jgi:hypothetical protein